MLKNSLYLALMVLLLASCSGNKLRVTKTNFEQEVLRAQNLVFTFNKELLADTVLLNKWDSTGYLRFEPSIPGKFMWTGKNELTFSPSGLMAPATDYKAFLNKELLVHGKSAFRIGKEPLQFHTPYLRLDDTKSYWAMGNDPAARVGVRLSLTFNNPVNPGRLKEKIKVLVGGK